MSNKRIEIKVVCSDCRGSGLYQGFCEKPGYPVVCRGCNGTGAEILGGTPFKKRRILKGVKGVALSRGMFIATGVGAAGDTVTYEQFLKGKLKYK